MLGARNIGEVCANTHRSKHRILEKGNAKYSNVKRCRKCLQKECP